MKKIIYLLIFLLTLSFVSAELKPFNIKTNVTLKGYTYFNNITNETTTAIDLKIETENEDYSLTNFTITNSTDKLEVFEFNMIRNITDSSLGNLSDVSNLILSCNNFFKNYITFENITQCWVTYEGLKKNKQECDAEVAFEKNNYDNATQLRQRSPIYTNLENNVNSINSEKTTCINERDKLKTDLETEIGKRLWKYGIGIIIGGLGLFGYYNLRGRRFSHVEKEVERKNPNILDEADKIAENKALREEILKQEEERMKRSEEPY